MFILIRCWFLLRVSAVVNSALYVFLEVALIQYNVYVNEAIYLNLVVISVVSLQPEVRIISRLPF